MLSSILTLSAGLLFPFVAATTPKHTNDTLILGWDSDVGAASYNFYWGPECFQTNEIGCFTNGTTVTIPLDGLYYYMFVRSVDTNDLESVDSNTIHWPLFESVTVAGTNLQCSTDLKHWTGTNSPWYGTNVRQSLFFRLSGTTNSAGISKVMTQ